LSSQQDQKNVFRFRSVNNIITAPARTGLDWIEQCFTSPPTQYRLYGRWFLELGAIVTGGWWLEIQPHCVNARRNRCQDLSSFPWRTGVDHQEALVVCGWRLSSRTGDLITSAWMKQMTWLRIIHS